MACDVSKKNTLLRSKGNTPQLKTQLTVAFSLVNDFEELFDALIDRHETRRLEDLQT